MPQTGWRAYTMANMPTPNTTTSSSDINTAPNRDQEDTQSAPTTTSSVPAQTPKPTTQNQSASSQSWHPSGSARNPWLSPHTAEHQKHAWYQSSLGMDSRSVGDQWGFHSASVSREHSPCGGK
ncbi:hypothetical protein J1614_001703 [Plenodomus biglobosus]|nr:hypothetical protein J1614_001703 [Plenodomus biglobosus]